MIRPFRESDTPRLIEVMATVFAEYGMTFEPDGFDRDVREVGRCYGPPGGAFFAAEDGARRHVLGFAGGDTPRPGVVELHRLYIDPAARGLGLGVKLCAHVETWARERGAATMSLWSDVRFTHAHALYARRGYVLVAQRMIADPDRSVELGFERLLAAPEAPAFPDTTKLRAAPLASALADPERAQRARMVAAAILDARALVRAGRVRAGALVPPCPEEVFGGEELPPHVEEVSILEAPGRVVVGFERQTATRVVRRLHPLLVASSSAARLPG